MKLSSTHLLCLMSGILLILVTSIKAEYEWNGKEWIWKETPTDGISEGSGDMDDYDETDEESYDDTNNDDDDEDYSDGSGDVSMYDGEDNNHQPGRNTNNGNLNQNTNNNYDGSKYNVQITPAPDTPYDPYSNGGVDSWPDEDIIVDPPQTTFASPIDNNNNNNIVNQNNNNFETKSPTSFFAQPGTMAAVIGGAVVGLLCAILCVMFVVYRMRKKDEGSYALDEPKRLSPTNVNSYSKPPSREFYA